MVLTLFSRNQLRRLRSDSQAPLLRENNYSTVWLMFYNGICGDRHCFTDQILIASGNSNTVVCVSLEETLRRILYPTKRRVPAERQLKALPRALDVDCS